MKTRYLARQIEELCFFAHKMGFVSGPRQCGKTTLAKMLLNRRNIARYWNWDDVEFRRIWVKQPHTIVPAVTGKSIPIVALDEIHKDRRWKRTLKGIYDTLETSCDILVTGSARLNVYRKSSDSLLGRYLHFRLHPFSLREMHNPAPAHADDLIDSIFSRSLTFRKHYQTNFAELMRFGPFPEPLFSQDNRKANLWRRNRREIIIREDLRDISRIPELSRVELMVALLPERVGSLFSVNSLREDMEVSFQSVKLWLTYLKELYYLYEVKPYHKSIPRALKKEGKIYFWDFSEVEGDAARFENLIANHLLKACHYWTDIGDGSFELSYLRNKEKREIDFLILKDNQPWLPVEVKWQETVPSPNWKTFLRVLPCKRGIQLVSKPHWKLHAIGDSQVLVAGAGEVLNYFV